MRQNHLEHSAVSVVGFHVAAVELDYLFGERKSYARIAVFSGVESVENMQNVLFGNTLAVVGDCQNNLVIFNGAFATVRFGKNTAKSVIAATASAVTIATAVILIFKDFSVFMVLLLLFLASLSLRLKFNKPSKENPRKTARRLQQICNKNKLFSANSAKSVHTRVSRAYYDFKILNKLYCVNK